MCGISGLISIDGNSNSDVLSQNCLNMIQAIHYRGPDNLGQWISDDGKVHFAHRRLSIIDLTNSAHQPMAYKDNWVLTFNGEIYNFLELKNKLISFGYSFNTHSDTEVLLACLDYYGYDIFNQLDGMYAFAAYNKSTKELLLARDPFGEKPLYYSIDSKTIKFSSELKSFYATSDTSLSIDRESLSNYLLLQYIPAPRTIYNGINKLHPGSYLKFNLNDNSHQIYTYYKYEPSIKKEYKSIDEHVDELESLLIDSLKKRLVSDVSIGAFLSGGIDSSIVCALIKKKLNTDIESFTIGFQGSDESEHSTASAIAKHLKINNSVQMLDFNNFEDFLKNSHYFFDEPLADSSCYPTFHLCRYAKRDVTVAISGDGADELFGGYHRYSEVIQQQKLIKFTNSNLGQLYYNQRIMTFSEDDFLNFFNNLHLPNHLKFLQHDLNNSTNFFDAVRKSDLENYMPGSVLAKVDRMSMLNSLEVRTPFLNINVANFSQKLPHSLLNNGLLNKIILRKLAKRYLPDSVVNLPKKGFGLPYGWNKEQFIKLLKLVNPNHYLFMNNYIDVSKYNEFVSKQSNNFNIYQVWSMLVLFNWVENKFH